MYKKNTDNLNQLKVDVYFKFIQTEGYIDLKADKSHVDNNITNVNIKIDNNIKNVNTKIANVVINISERENKIKKYLNESHIT